MHIALAVFTKNEAEKIVTEVTNLLPGQDGFGAEFHRRFRLHGGCSGGFVETDFDDGESRAHGRSHLGDGLSQELLNVC